MLKQPQETLVQAWFITNPETAERFFLWFKELSSIKKIMGPLCDGWSAGLQFLRENLNNYIVKNK